MCSQVDSRRVMRDHNALVEALNMKTTRYQALLTDFVNLVEVHDRSRKEVKGERERSEKMREEMGRIEERMREMQKREDEKEQALRTMEAQLKDARREVASQIGYVKALEADRDELENRLRMVKNSLEDQLGSLSAESEERLAFIREPSLYRSHSRAFAASRFEVREEEEELDESVDYDETDDEDERDKEREDRKDRTPPRLIRTPPFRRQPAALPRTTHQRMMERARGGIEAVRQSVRDRRKSGEMTKVTTTVKMERNQLKTTVSIKRASISTPRGKKSGSWTGAHAINQRPHRFEEYTGMTKKCAVCSLGFFFRSKPGVRCIDCTQHAHEKCKHKLVCPCVPLCSTPSARLGKTSRLPLTSSLHEFCPPTAPMIAVPIVRCVVALENKGLAVEGIYRRSGNKALITKALDVLCNSKEAPPRLEVQEMEVITGCITTFLGRMKDPLIPKTSRAEFITACIRGSREELERAIDDLPQPNRDTLAYLCVHWHKVIKYSSTNKMSVDNLSRCLAPTVVGLQNLHSLASAGDDARNAMMVLETLLKMETEYWKSFLSFDDAENAAALRTKTAPTPGKKLITNDRWR